MYPELFHLPLLRTYGVLVALAFLAGLWMAGKFGKEAGLHQQSVTDLGIYCALAAMVGAKLMMYLVDLPYYIERPGEIFSGSSLRAGGVFYGGLIAALIVAFWHMRRTKLPPLRTADVFAPAIALGHAIGRLGCFAAGCCWGTECHRPWAVTFTDPAATEITGVPLNQPVHPTQLYEAFAEFLIFGILFWRIRRPHREGQIIGLYLLLYSTARFIVEFFRVHELGKVAGGPFDTSQYISVGLFALGLWFLRRPRQRLRPATTSVV